MTTFTPAQLAGIAAKAGFRGRALVTAVAVALAESGGNSAAVHTNLDAHRSRDRGLWQINSYWHKEVTDAQAFDPTGNAAAAYRISRAGADWSEWTTWRTGAALAQATRARIGVAQAIQAATATAPAPGAATDVGWWDELKVGFEGAQNALPGFPGDVTLGPLSDAAGSVDSTLGAVKQLSAIIVRTGAWVSDPHNWLRVGLVAGGSVGILLALGMIARTGAAGDTAQGAAKAAGGAASLAVPAKGALRAVKAAGGTGKATRALKAVKVAS